VKRWGLRCGGPKEWRPAERPAEKQNRRKKKVRGGGAALNVAITPSRENKTAPSTPSRTSHITTTNEEKAHTQKKHRNEGGRGNEGVGMFYYGSGKTQPAAKVKDLGVKGLKGPQKKNPHQKRKCANGPWPEREGTGSNQRPPRGKSRGYRERRGDGGRGCKKK